MRHRGRFIGRNHFLSDYVKFLTGRRRSAKQVGSRLQQLKDTCRELESEWMYDCAFLSDLLTTRRLMLVLYLITGSRSLSPRRDPRRNRKSNFKSSLRRSVSSSPELSDEPIEQTPEPQVNASRTALVCRSLLNFRQEYQGHTSPQYVSGAEAQPHSIYSAVPAQSASPVYEYPTQCSYANDQPSTAQYYAQSSQFYSHEWTNGVQSTQSTYQVSPQQWVNYYPQAESQQQFAYYNNSQYY